MIKTNTIKKEGSWWDCRRLKWKFQMKGTLKFFFTIYKDRVTSLRKYGLLAITNLLEFVFSPLVQACKTQSYKIPSSLCLSLVSVSVSLLSDRQRYLARYKVNDRFYLTQEHILLSWFTRQLKACLPFVCLEFGPNRSNMEGWILLGHKVLCWETTPSDPSHFVPFLLSRVSAEEFYSQAV